MSDDKKIASICRSCGASRAGDVGTCWMCGASLSPKLAGGAVAIASAQRGAATFGLDSLLLTITLVAVCLGVGMIYPGVGVLLAIVAVPAYIRAIFAVARRKRAGKSVGPGGKIEVFFISLAVMSVVGIASTVAFVATCFPAGLLGLSVASGAGGAVSGWFIFVALGLGLAAASAVAWVLIRGMKNLG